MQLLELIVLIAAALATILVFRRGLKVIRRADIVAEGHAGLLYHKGKFVEVLAPGRHIRWGRHYTLLSVDLRRTNLTVAGQEVLTSDNVSLKVSALVVYQLTDPVKATSEVQNWLAELYNIVQLAMRNVVNGAAIDTLLTTRAQLGTQMLPAVQVEAAKIGVTVHTVEMKDLMFHAEIKRAFADVLKARQEGQAALERARGESAALRNLANAARLIEGNPALMNLRVLQSLASAQGAGSTLVLGVPGGFVPVKNGSTPAPPSRGGHD